MGKNNDYFNVVIMHGTSKEYLKVKQLVESLGYHSIVLAERYSGKHILEKLRDKVWDAAHCAIVVMSPDDLLENGDYRARQNVVFELGYCIAAFDSIEDHYWYNGVIMVKELKVELFSDIEGIEYISYDNSIDSDQLIAITHALKKVKNEAQKYYGKLR